MAERLISTIKSDVVGVYESQHVLTVRVVSSRVAAVGVDGSVLEKTDASNTWVELTIAGDGTESEGKLFANDTEFEA